MPIYFDRLPPGVILSDKARRQVAGDLVADLYAELVRLQAENDVLKRHNVELIERLARAKNDRSSN